MKPEEFKNYNFTLLNISYRSFESGIGFSFWIGHGGITINLPFLRIGILEATTSRFWWKYIFKFWKKEWN